MPNRLDLPRRSACSRPGCRSVPAVVLRIGGAPVTYCTTHAEDKAGADGVEVSWLAEGFTVCPIRVCSRVIPERIIGNHYNLAGLPCPPPGVTLRPAIMGV